MALQLSWTIEGQKQLSRKLFILAENVKDWTPAFKAVAQQLRQTFETDVFQTRGSAIDEHWAPLSPGYAAWKARNYPGKGILERTGAMRGGFRSEWKGDMARVWNGVKYFKYHQSKESRGRLPRRVMLKLANPQRELIVKIFHTHFQKVTKAAS